MTLQTYTPYPMSLLSTSYTYTATSKVKAGSHYDTAHLQPPTKYPYRVSTSYTLQLMRYSPDMIFNHKVTMARS